MANRLPRARTLKGDPRLAYFDSGGGQSGEPPLVLLHGRFFRSEDWENIFPRLATRYRVIAYDARGHGRSARAERYALSDLAADALRIVAEVAKAPAILIGHSLGALTALVAAAREPERVRALVLEDPPLELLSARWEGPFFTGLGAALERAGDPNAFRKAVAQLPLVAPGPRGERTVGEVRGFYALDRMVTCYGAVDPAYVRERIARPEPEAKVLLDDALARVRQPTLLLVADVREGGMTPETDVEPIRALPDCKVAPFPRTGHRIHGLRPEQFLEALEPFLRRVRSAPATTTNGGA